MEEGKTASSAWIQAKSNGETVAMRRPVSTQVTNSATSAQCMITVPKSVLGDARRPISPLVIEARCARPNNDGQTQPERPRAVEQAFNRLDTRCQRSAERRTVRRIG